MKSLPAGVVTGRTKPAIRTFARSLLENIMHLVHWRQDCLKSCLGRLPDTAPIQYPQKIEFPFSKTKYAEREQ